MRFTCNLEVQLLLKQGQVEVDAGPFIHDYRESILIHRQVVEDLNQKIRVGTAGATEQKHLSGYPLHSENRENCQKNSLSGKTQGIWKFCQNKGNLVCSSCKFPDSKGKIYFNICRENSSFF